MFYIIFCDIILSYKLFQIEVLQYVWQQLIVYKSELSGFHRIFNYDKGNKMFYIF